MLEFRKDNDQKELKIKELNSNINILHGKLEDAQKSLESNATMITWLNQ